MNQVDQRFQTYFDALRRVPLDDKTEHTDRGALEALLAAFGRTGVVVQHEPRRQDDKGSPDFKITSGGAVLGYVEVKTIGENLDAVLKSAQIKKYRLLSDNILLTDYLHFIWIGPQGIERESLAFADDLDNRKYRLNPDRAAVVGRLIGGFFSQPPAGIARAQALAAALATRSHLLRDGLAEALAHQAAHQQQGRLYGLFNAFRVQVFHDLELGEFADAFAQMLAYGLFLARLNTDETITLDNARQFVPGAFPLIRELIDFIGELRSADYGAIRWLVEEILSIMNGLDLAAIRLDLSFSNRRAIRRAVRADSEAEHRLFERDPFVYFYEDFLARYDAKLRKSRGVYYTPPPVVNFIIRAIDDLLRSEFGIADGLADHRRVTLLDFATGTGTFLLEALERMFETIGDGQAKREMLVREHVLKNVFGFEYLIAPYTIAHLKLSQYLKDKGIALGGAERLRIYLTNTLEPIAPQANFLLPALSDEAAAAQTVKDQPILVITGNPPYSGHSRNKGEWIARAIDAYKMVDGEKLGEKNPKWLNDDYVKFIRFAQMKIDAVPEGIVGIITNHSFLDNPTFRGMRQSLMKSFDRIYVLDLHGNAKKKEQAPDGSKDENVFDIEQGVAISLFVKSRHATDRKVFRADLFGMRLAKYEALARTAFAGVEWREVVPAKPFYLFETADAVLALEYRAFPAVGDIFPVNSVGIVTARDNLAIQFSREDIMRVVRDFSERSPEDAREHYGLGKDVRDWRVAWAQADVVNSGITTALARQVLYRPFDARWTYFTGHSRGFHCYPRSNVMRHMLQDNIGLITSRLTKGETFKHVQVCDSITEVICMSPTTSNNGFLFPLFLYSISEQSAGSKKTVRTGTMDWLSNTERSENIAPAFRSELIARFGKVKITPEQIFGYVYAVLHAPAYRSRYAEFLRGDFPRIPLAPERAQFELLAGLGWDLAQVHLLKVRPAGRLAQYRGQGDNLVETPRYVAAEAAVYINAGQFFAPVAADVWGFQIGGYQVLEKYLKSRKGRVLSLDEVTQVERIVGALGATIEAMAAIDEVYVRAFGLGGVG
ncbi:N-6 DNA methylase [Acidiphilium sp. PA]|uniref:type ISP restriction/modification enzyme n=1 Tax=Acidiphilium sp. PA TaxID=2871705 RepID=UPI002243A8A5|nr:type ISP restriction/modification enzyme [Acidiphilium sp. PA]MCW8307498.1 N-6 DNA methylase [Acidiphilium sp. PA]